MTPEELNAIAAQHHMYQQAKQAGSADVNEIAHVLADMVPALIAEVCQQHEDLVELVGLFNQLAGRVAAARRDSRGGPMAIADAAGVSVNPDRWITNGNNPTSTHAWRADNHQDTDTVNPPPTGGRHDDH